MALTLTAEDWTRMAEVVGGTGAARSGEEQDFYDALVARVSSRIMDDLNTNNGQVDVTIDAALTTTKSQAAVQGAGIVKSTLDTINPGAPSADLQSAFELLIATEEAADADGLAATKVEAEFSAYSTDVDDIVTAAVALDNVTSEDAGDTLAFRFGEAEEITVDISEANRRLHFGALTTATLDAEIGALITAANSWNLAAATGEVGVTQIL